MSQLSLHSTTASDIDTILSMESEPENSQFIRSTSKYEHRQLIKDENIEHWLLKSENGSTIGFVILAGIKDKKKSIEFRRIVIKEKGKGFGRMAIQEVKKHCFEKLHCQKLWLDVMEINERARHLYITEGFKEEGKLRKRVLIRNKYESLIIMSMLKKDYEGRNGNKF